MQAYDNSEHFEYVLSLSYGKDSIACLEACNQLGWRIDRAIHAEVWATDDIPADLPPMVEFKERADKIIKERYGIEVEHVFATYKEGSVYDYPKENALLRERKLSYERVLYSKTQKGNHIGENRGFPLSKGAWCNDRLKATVLDSIKTDIRQAVQSQIHQRKENRTNQRVSDKVGAVVQQRVEERCTKGFSTSAERQVVSYLGIASDEPERIERHTKPGYLLPLVEIGWDEPYCRKWCEENGLLSPIYTEAARGGCWFCHNQSMDQLRLLRKNYPDLWKMLLKWDNDSPVTFKSDGHTVHDLDIRISMEEAGLVPCDRRFRWKTVKEKQSEWLDSLLSI